MVSLERYRELFAVPGVRSTLIASIIGRMPIGVAGLAILLFVQTSTGSFSRAGTAASLYVLGLAVIAPLLGRSIDRVGPRPVLLICTLVYPLALLIMTGLVQFHAHALAVAVSAFVAGAALPPITICMRALFPRLLHGGGLLQTAYSVDSALIETIFILGPALVAAFVAFGYPVAGVLLAALAAAVGGHIFLRAPGIRQWPAVAPTDEVRSVLGPLRNRRLLVIFAATVFYSVAFGLFEVGVTAYATARQMPGLAGIMLALASLGSAAGAVIYGSHHWKLAPVPQFRIALTAMAVGTMPLVIVDHPVVFGLLSVIAGVPMATVIAVQSLLISRVVARDMMAEAFTWGSTCLLGGIGAGLALGGWLAEYFDAAWIFFGAASATLTAALLATVMIPTRGVH